MLKNFTILPTLPDKSTDLLQSLSIQDFAKEESLIDEYVKGKCFLNFKTASSVFHFSDDKLFDKKIKYLKVFETQLNENSLSWAFSHSVFGFSSHKTARYIWEHRVIKDLSAQHKQKLLKKAAILAGNYYKGNKVNNLNNFQSTFSFLIKDLGLVFSNQLKRALFNATGIPSDELEEALSPILLSVELDRVLESPQSTSLASSQCVNQKGAHSVNTISLLNSSNSPVSAHVNINEKRKTIKV